MRYFTHIVLCCLSLLLSGYADEIKPDWRARFDAWTRKERRMFPAPVADQSLSITLNNGMEWTGALVEAGDDQVVLLVEGQSRPVTLLRSEMDRVSRMRCFREDYARGQALFRVKNEKQAMEQGGLLSLDDIRRQLSELTSLQFNERAAKDVGAMVCWSLRVDDVRVNFLGANECLTSPLMEDDGIPLLVTFSQPGEVAMTLERYQPIRVSGLVESVNKMNDVCRISLRDAVLQF
ncbi:MAG: hypothetical protein EOL87_11945 [Spartobacteria bacterium]|nr:hypothetical protein [Spartobacteria bacterium]